MQWRRYIEGQLPEDEAEKQAVSEEAVDEKEVIQNVKKMDLNKDEQSKGQAVDAER